MSNPTATDTIWWGADTASDFRGFSPLFASHYGNLPTFVGRYVNNYVPDAAELAWYGANHIARLLICNSEQGNTSNGDYSEGFLLGAQAAAAASKMGYPKKCYLPVDIEATFLLSSAFLVGYFHGADQGGYTPGAYLNVLNPNHTSAWIVARAQYSLPAYIYSSEPEPTAIWDAVQPAWFDFSQSDLGKAYAADVIVWQYGEGELGGSVDLDVANDTGYHLMWGADPLPPTVHKVLHKAALKQFPNHVCPAALGANGKPLPPLAVGTVVVPTGKRTPHWSEYTLPKTPIHGWLLAADVS
jgi:hypothetical protein